MSDQRPDGSVSLSPTSIANVAEKGAEATKHAGFAKVELKDSQSNRGQIQKRARDVLDCEGASCDWGCSASCVDGTSPTFRRGPARTFRAPTKAGSLNHSEDIYCHPYSLGTSSE